MPKVSSNGIDIVYEEHGSAEDPVLLMVQGLGMPLTGWPPDLVDALVAEQFRVVIFDNRDIGNSQLLNEFKVPNMLWQTLRRKFGMTVKSPYQLTDMMRDVVGLMDALNIESAHIVGVSMGGMISQLLAIHEPQRVRSLTSIMSTTGRRKLPGPTKPVTRHIMRGPKAPTTEERLVYNRKLWRLIGSPKFEMSDEELDMFLLRNFERGMTAAGIARQTLAILAAPSRVAELRQLDVPTQVIHGEQDPLIPIACGIDTARSIPGARVTTISGMGHDLPPALLGRLTRLIVQHAKAAEPASDTDKVA